MVSPTLIVDNLLITFPYFICIFQKVEIENNSFFSCISRKNVYRHIISTGCNIIQQSGKAFPHVINILLLIKKPKKHQIFSEKICYSSLLLYICGVDKRIQ